MDFNLTEEQIAFQNSVRSLADKYLKEGNLRRCLLYTSPSPRDRQKSRMPSSA